VPKLSSEIVAAAQAAARKWEIPASVNLAQFGLESGWGAHQSGKWNYGGVTAKVKDAVFPYKPGTPLEPATLCWTHEEVGGKVVKCQRWFKDYSGPEVFFDAHAKLLATAPVYAKAKALLPNLEAFVREMAKHYATAHDYADQLLKIINQSGLRKYDIA
jgi:flagellum-specific peptidoglycan hydrolase FlgJ